MKILYSKTCTRVRRFNFRILYHGVFLITYQQYFLDASLASLLILIWIRCGRSKKYKVAFNHYNKLMIEFPRLHQEVASSRSHDKTHLKQRMWKEELVEINYQGKKLIWKGNNPCSPIVIFKWIHFHYHHLQTSCRKRALVLKLLVSLHAGFFQQFWCRGKKYVRISNQIYNDLKWMELTKRSFELMQIKASIRPIRDSKLKTQLYPISFNKN